MKSYLKFLSHNKAYAAIDVFGLAVSMMFVVLIGCYAWQENHIDAQHSKADRMYYLGLDLHGEKIMGGHWKEQSILKDRFPEIETSTALFRASQWLEFEGIPVETSCLFVDSTFYDIFDFRLIRGDRSTVLDIPSGIVVNEEYARRVWGDVDPIGKSIMRSADGESLVVTGVMEPMTNTALMTVDRRPVDMLLNIVAAESVKPDVISSTMNDATAVDIVLVAKEGHDLTARKKEYEEALKPEFWILNLPEDNVRLEVYPFNESYFSEGASQNSLYSNVNYGDGKLLKLLFSAGLVILLFAIMNYINLTVALTGKRAKEMATRRLLGEGRIRVMWRLIGESTLLCSVSMIIGLVLAFAVEPYASALLKTPLSITGCLNFTTVSFLVSVLFIMSFTSGMIPALMLSSMKPIQAVKGDFRRKSNMVYGKVFIVIQNVATITMVAGAMTMDMQVRHLIDAPLGYNTDHIMNITHKYFNLNKVKKGEMLRDELLKLACVDEVGYCIDVPIDGGRNNTVNFDGRTISLQEFTGDSIYMDILGIKLKKDNHSEGHIREYISVGALEAFGLDEDATHYPYYQSWHPIAGVFEDFRIRTVLSDQHPLIIALIDDPNYFDKVPHWSVLIKVHGDEIQALEQVKGVFERLYSGEYQDKAFEKPYLR